ncbi:hypothetical protein [Sphingomonas bacterium]|uniref:hypothetical protein n=1 Tax=Sphingomonas bacterium TaxID=1895847 RepID=UPI00157745B3|nr:hypothetical protein [Sphingomonas bacterium]
MIIAIGQPGALPRKWLETSSALVLAANLEAGEVASPAELDPDGRPVVTPLPAESNVVFEVKS